MKDNNAKYLKAVLAALGLKAEQADFDGETLKKAASWAVGQPISLQPYQPVAFLRPVLETLRGAKPGRYFKPQPLSLERSYFPVENKPSQADLDLQFQTLKDALAKASDEQLLTVLEYHSSTLATSTELDDLPLYDFIKITSAIAHCLEHGTGKLRLAGGSVSGIQSYLYDIVSKRASKLLKGRSFYLQLLTDSLVEKMLETSGLSDCHVVYSSGGGFYVLMPEYEGLKDKFQDFKTEVVRQIYKIHKTNLFTDFAITEPFDQQKHDGKIGKIWDELIGELNARKLQRLADNSELLKDLHQLLEEDAELGGEENNNRDEITNDELPADEKPKPNSIGTSEDKITVSKFSKGQVDKLGRNLRDADFWITSKEDFHREAFEDPLGYWHLLRVKDNLPRNLPKDAIVRTLNTPELHRLFIFYGGYRTPVIRDEKTLKLAQEENPETEMGDPMTFSVMAKGERLDRLGILRMDVDGLGEIFSKNIGANPSFSRYAAVSRALDWFFKGYLNSIHQQEAKLYKDKTLIVYSGGDDLFIVGRWKEVLDMALEIRKQFDDWSCGKLTLSGGLSVLPHKFPVMQGARIAGDEEHEAKNYKLSDAEKKEKNAFCLFGTPMSWVREMPVVETLRGKIIELRKEHKLNASLIGKIHIHATALKEQEKRGLPPKWIWNLIYDFSRMEQRLKNKKDATAIIKYFRDMAFSDEKYKSKESRHRFLTLLQVAARWVEMEDRTIKAYSESEPIND